MVVSSLLGGESNPWWFSWPPRICDSSRLVNSAQLSQPLSPFQWVASSLWMPPDLWQNQCRGNKGKAPSETEPGSGVPTGNCKVTRIYHIYIYHMCWYCVDTTMMNDKLHYMRLVPCSSCRFLIISVFIVPPLRKFLTWQFWPTHTHNKKHQHMWKSSNTTTVQH